jgi:hypothetical protein
MLPIVSVPFSLSKEKIPGWINLSANLMEGTSKPELPSESHHTHGFFVRNREPLEELTNPIPISNFDRFIRAFVVVSNWNDRRDDTMATALEEKIFVRSRTVIARVVAGETLIIPVRDKLGDPASVFSLNNAGSLIWNLLGSPRTVTQLSIAFAKEFGVEPQMVWWDVADFLNEMAAVGMVELSASVVNADAEPRRTESWQQPAPGRQRSAVAGFD